MIHPFDIAGPCCVCGATNYALSCGGPSICPSCDCGNFGPDVVKRQKIAIDSLSARVKELEARQADDLAEFGLMEMRAILAEQQRDEAYVRLKPFAEAEQDIGEGAPDDWDIWESPAAINIKVGHLRAARDLVRRQIVDKLP